jgi:hypothetical protein
VPACAHPGHDGMCSCSAAHRSVSKTVKEEVYAAYENLYPGITAYCEEPGYTHGAAQRCEVDHFCPVGVGCSNDKENLWIQRGDSVYCATESNCIPMGFRQKDALESWASRS